MTTTTTTFPLCHEKSLFDNNNNRRSSDKSSTDKINQAIAVLANKQQEKVFRLEFRDINKHFVRPRTFYQ